MSDEQNSNSTPKSPPVDWHPLLDEGPSDSPVYYQQAKASPKKRSTPPIVKSASTTKLSAIASSSSPSTASAAAAALDNRPAPETTFTDLLKHMYNETLNVLKSSNLTIEDQQKRVALMRKHTADWGYPFEEHTVETEDGFYLTIHRIKHGSKSSLLLHSNENVTEEVLKERKEQPRPVVFLQHGILCSSATWLICGPKQSLAFILADAGFDVWMGNNRGTIFGMSHRTYTPRDAQFWNWSFHEMGKHDVPTQVNYILKKTKASKLTYIGHSQGCAQAFAGFSLSASLQSKINLMIAMAPACTLSHQRSTFLRTLSHLKASKILSLLGVGEFSPNTIDRWGISRIMLPPVVRKYPALSGLWSLLDDCAIDPEHLSLLISLEPSPTSVQNISHWAQLVRNGKFEAYDYGTPQLNELAYGRQYSTPPEYDLSKVTIPVAIFYGEKDFIANSQDIEATLLKKLPNIVHVKKEENFAHNDFVWGREAWSKIFFDIIHILVQHGCISFNPQSAEQMRQRIREEQRAEELKIVLASKEREQTLMSTLLDRDNVPAHDDILTDAEALELEALSKPKSPAVSPTTTAKPSTSQSQAGLFSSSQKPTSSEQTAVSTATAAKAESESTSNSVRQQPEPLSESDINMLIAEFLKDEENDQNAPQQRQPRSAAFYYTSDGSQGSIKNEISASRKRSVSTSTMSGASIAEREKTNTPVAANKQANSAVASSQRSPRRIGGIQADDGQDKSQNTALGTTVFNALDNLKTNARDWISSVRNTIAGGAADKQQVNK